MGRGLDGGQRDGQYAGHTHSGAGHSPAFRRVPTEAAIQHRKVLGCARALRHLYHMLSLHCGELVHRDMAVDNVIRRVRSGTRRRRALVADRPNLAGTAPGEEAALKPLAEGWHGTGETDGGWLSIRIRHGSS